MWLKLYYSPDLYSMSISTVLSRWVLEFSMISAMAGSSLTYAATFYGICCSPCRRLFPPVWNLLLQSFSGSRRFLMKSALYVVWPGYRHSCLCRSLWRNKPRRWSVVSRHISTASRGFLTGRTCGRVPVWPDARQRWNQSGRPWSFPWLLLFCMRSGGILSCPSVSGAWFCHFPYILWQNRFQVDAAYYERCCICCWYGW